MAKTRAYRSERRTEQAAETRRAIVIAARAEFGERGYAATTLEQIARRAKVSVQTIYASFGNKLALLVALNDFIDEEGGVGEQIGRLRDARTPRDLIAGAVRITRGLNERFGDIMRTLERAAGADPDAGAVWTEGMRRHRQGSEYTAELLRGRGALRDEVSPRRAADVIDYFTTPASFANLAAMEWSFDEIETWLIDQIARIVLRRSKG